MSHWAKKFLLVTLLMMAAGLAAGQTMASDRAPSLLEEWILLATSGQDEALVTMLEDAAQDQNLVPLERDQLMMAFIDRLRAMAPGSAGPATLKYLLDYQPQALRPDEHQPVVPVPVLNVGAAAKGLINGWRRQEAAYAGAVLLDHDPAALVQAYAMHDEPLVRRGLLAALDGADHGQLEMISFMALSAMEQEPALASLAGEAALRTGDARALEQLVRNGRGSDLTHILRASRQRLSPSQVERLLDNAIKHARPEVASIAIAELAPGLIGRPGAEERLFGLLGSEALGSTAALTLAQNPSDATVVRLGQMLRDSDNALAARRARLALDLVRFGADTEVLP